jgi:hypothetical protein
MLEELDYKMLGKFTVLSEPLQNPPHKCCGCGRYSSGDPTQPLTFIDMGFDIEFLGEAFICVEGCFKEIMNQLGVLTKEQTEKYRWALEEANQKVATLSEANKELTDAMGSLSRAGVMRAPISVPVPVAEPQTREENKSVIPTESNSNSSGSKQRPTKQTNVRRSTGVSSSPGDDLLGEI